MFDSVSNRNFCGRVVRQVGLCLATLALCGAAPPPGALIPLNLLNASGVGVALSPRGQLLVLNDLKAGSLVVLDLQGKRLREVKSKGMGPKDFEQPAAVMPYPSGFLLLTNAGLVWLDSDLRAEMGWILPLRVGGPGMVKVIGDRGPLEEVAVWEARAIDSRSAVIFGDFLDAKGWRKGVARLRPRGDGENLVLELLASEVVRDHEPSPYYLFPLNLNPGLVVANREVYRLRFGPNATLEQLTPTSRSIPLPKPFDAPLPLLGSLGGLGNQPALFARLNTFPLARSIHEWKGGIYLLTSTPRAKAGPAFALWRWDEKAGWRGPLQIDAPPEAQEATLAPGPDGIVVLFKKAILRPAEQELIGFRLLQPEAVLGGLR